MTVKGQKRRSSGILACVAAIVMISSMDHAATTANAFQSFVLSKTLSRHSAQRRQRQGARRGAGLNFRRPFLGGRQDTALLTTATNDTAVAEPVDAETTVLVDWEIPETRRLYDWRDFFPKGGIGEKLRWLITGASDTAAQSDKEMHESLSSLARMLILLREYERKHGTPTEGDASIQRKVVADITQDLYGSGAPTWVLDTVMERVAEGMTGKEGVEFLLLPNRCFTYYPQGNSQCPGTNMFKINNGFDIAKLGQVEQVAVRLASFASNTQSVERLNANSFRIPKRRELDSIKQQELWNTSHYLSNETPDAEELAEEILNLASSTYGLFFFLNNPRFQIAINATADEDEFWEVKDSTRDIFSRLAAAEASTAMTNIRQASIAEKPLYSKNTKSFLRILSSAGAASMWFGGSFADMLVSGALAVTVSYIVTYKKLAFEERVLSDVVAAFFVGLVAGLLSIKWPNRFCFGAIAVASVMDFMQGFKVVYAVIEVMSKNKVTGTARLLEGILFTGLISYSLIFGLDFAFRLMHGAAGLPLDYASMLTSAHGVSQKFFPFILPFTATAWSALFTPTYRDLPLMAFHGMLAMCLSWAGVPSYAAAACVTFSAGIISRFTGRQALGNTLAGLYALVPGTYMVRALLSPNKAGFIENVLIQAITIGLGGWTGTILCSPTILGKTSGLHGRASFWGKNAPKKSETMMYF